MHLQSPQRGHGYGHNSDVDEEVHNGRGQVGLCRVAADAIDGLIPGIGEWATEEEALKDDRNYEGTAQTNYDERCDAQLCHSENADVKAQDGHLDQERCDGPQEGSGHEKLQGDSD